MSTLSASSHPALGPLEYSCLKYRNSCDVYLLVSHAYFCYCFYLFYFAVLYASLFVTSLECSVRHKRETSHLAPGVALKEAPRGALGWVYQFSSRLTFAQATQSLLLSSWGRDGQGLRQPAAAR